MDVKVVPEAVTEDEGVGAGGFCGGEEGAEAGDFFIGDGEADDLLDFLVMVLLVLR